MRKVSAAPTYMIASGWWSSDQDFSEEFPTRKELGDSLIRSVAFFDHWLTAIRRVACPAEIVVVDSNAPCKPAEEKRAEVNWVELPFNARHSTDHLGQWCGWSWSVFVSANYALSTEHDYYVYVEQDCLIEGRGIIERCIEEMTTGFMFGHPEQTPQPLQQSFFVIERSKLQEFLKNFAAIKHRDGTLSPEWKFLCATRPWLVVAANLGVLKSKRLRKLLKRFAIGRLFDVLPFGVGRARPIPMQSEHYYFQHGSAEEVATFLKGCSS